MQVTRYYTDNAGITRFEQMDPVQSEPWSKPQPGAINVRQLAAGTVMDWHPAPRRQIVIHLAGLLEIELEDGTTHRFGPGDARLMDDLTGKGHLTRVVGDEPVVQAVIVLD
jgi:quercetin dioxygenase-like cupin family protein